MKPQTTPNTVRFVVRIVLLIASLFIITGATWIDSLDVSQVDKFGESSWTEYTQELFLFISTVLLIFAAYKIKPFRSLLIAISYLTFMYFIREWNNTIGGWWKIGVISISLFYIPYLIKNRKAVWLQVQEVWETFAMGIFVIGNLIVHTFSRVYGQTHIWQNTLGDLYHRSVKNASEESIELLGYTIMFCGVLFLIEKLYHQSISLHKRMTQEKMIVV